MTDTNPEPITVKPPRIRDHRESRAIQIIGGRLREARIMCNISQRRAAEQLNLANSGMLAKIENATDNRNIPLWLIRRAATLYEVSIDWLFGESDDWETGVRMTQERQVSRWLFDTWKEAHERDIQCLRLLNDRLEGLAFIVGGLLPVAKEAEAALAKVAELNPEFQDLRAGACLVAAVGRVTTEAMIARARLAKLPAVTLTAPETGSR